MVNNGTGTSTDYSNLLIMSFFGGFSIRTYVTKLIFDYARIKKKESSLRFADENCKFSISLNAYKLNVNVCSCLFSRLLYLFRENECDVVQRYAL